MARGYQTLLHASQPCLRNVAVREAILLHQVDGLPPVLVRLPCSTHFSVRADLLLLGTLRLRLLHRKLCRVLASSPASIYTNGNLHQ